MRLTLMPRASRRQPMEAAARPLPRLDTTPPVTKMYFADINATSLIVRDGRARCAQSSIAGLGAWKQLDCSWGDDSSGVECSERAPSKMETRHTLESTVEGWNFKALESKDEVCWFAAGNVDSVLG